MAGLSLKDAIAQYGYVGSLANTVPELKKILLSSAASNATVDEFTRAVQDSNWWKNSADRDKQMQILKATKPGEFNSQRNQAIQKVQLISRKLGVNPGSKLNQYAASIMRFGWTDDELEQHLSALIDSKRGPVAHGDLYGGDVGNMQQQIRQIYANYGIAYSNVGVMNRVRSVLMGTSNITAVQAEAMNAAKSKYAALAPEIDNGKTVADLAQPYIASMAQTLELPDGTVQLTDPKIQKALTARDPKTSAPTVTPLWQFEQDLKNDPRWDHTKNAVNTAYDQVARIGRDWGFVSQ
jgi:hypothetical protein